MDNGGNRKGIIKGQKVVISVRKWMRVYNNETNIKTIMIENRGRIIHKWHNRMSLRKRISHLCSPRSIAHSHTENRGITEGHIRSSAANLIHLAPVSFKDVRYR